MEWVWVVGLILLLELMNILSKLLAIAMKPYRDSPLNRIPGPPNGNLLFGYAPVLLRADNPVDPMLELAKQHPGAPLIHFRIIWNESRVLVTDAHFVQRVCNSPSIFSKENLPGYSLLRTGLGDGLITLNGEEHTKHRNLINPAFRHSNLKNLVQIFKQQTEILLQELEVHVEEKTICVNEFMNKITLNIIGLAGFGFNFTAFDPNPNTIGAKTYKAFSELIAAHNELHAFLPFLKYLPTIGNLKIRLNIRYLNRIVLELVKSKRASLDSRKDQPRDVLDLLIASYDEETGFRLTDTELSAHVKTFLAAGHETTSMLLTWTLYVLSQHPNVVDKLRAEIQREIGSTNDFTMAHLEKLTYMNYVFKEVLRLYPPVAIVARRATCDTNLGVHLIPEGTVVLISPKVLGRVPWVWEEPEKFYPERWERDIYHSFQLIPFLKGPRNCIGQKFAMLEAKVILAMTLRKFQFDMSPGDFAKVKQSLHVTLRPKEDLWMQISTV